MGDGQRGRIKSTQMRCMYKQRAKGWEVSGQVLDGGTKHISGTARGCSRRVLVISRGGRREERASVKELICAVVWRCVEVLLSGLFENVEGGGGGEGGRIRSVLEGGVLLKRLEQEERVANHANRGRKNMRRSV